jgi:hypothetical protein
MPNVTKKMDQSDQLVTLLVAYLSDTSPTNCNCKYAGVKKKLYVSFITRHNKSWDKFIFLNLFSKRYLTCRKNRPTFNSFTFIVDAKGYNLQLYNLDSPVHILRHMENGYTRKLTMGDCDHMGNQLETKVYMETNNKINSGRNFTCGYMQISPPNILSTFNENIKKLKMQITCIPCVIASCRQPFASQSKLIYTS